VFTAIEVHPPSPSQVALQPSVQSWGASEPAGDGAQWPGDDGSEQV
jgi:hypothetical protein